MELERVKTIMIDGTINGIWLQLNVVTNNDEEMTLSQAETIESQLVDALQTVSGVIVKDVTVYEN